MVIAMIMYIYSNNIHLSFFFLYVSVGKIWCTFLESPQPWEFISLSTVITTVIKVMDQAESSHIVDAGKHRMACFSFHFI